MIRALLSIFLLLGIAACDSGQPSSQAAKPALWEVRGPDGEQGFLFPTIHVLPQRVDWKSPAIADALQRSDTLLVEAGDILDRDEAQAIYAELARRRTARPLCARLAPRDCTQLDRAIDEAGLEPAHLAALDTWAAALAIANARGTSGSSAYGIDRALLAESTLPVAELEGTRAQLAIFDTLPESEQIDLLGYAIGEDEPEEIDTAEAWARGDMATIASASTRGMLADPELRDALLVRRNADWVSKVEQMLRDGKHPFVAVGAAHLAGEDGLPALLAARGWTVRRVQ